MAPMTAHNSLLSSSGESFSPVHLRTDFLSRSDCQCDLPPSGDRPGRTRCSPSYSLKLSGTV
ncbi:hypothetical protein [Desulfotruncus arcticus]|uniref:hypothetical protein n=1 Tax=Desulfotruncus arcticus TaxID=341036 RepID=UPI001041F686|nr:hypothetical protein [Desulfotruncus arcticus]